jgi:hypothetical protein
MLLPSITQIYSSVCVNMERINYLKLFQLNINELNVFINADLTSGSFLFAMFTVVI